MRKNIIFLSLLLSLSLFSSRVTLAATINFSNPLGNNMSNVDSVLKSAQGYLTAAAGTIAVVFLLIGAVMYMISLGDKEMAEQAKRTIMYAIGGVAIVVAAPVFWKEITTILGGNPSGIATTSSAVKIAMNVLGLLLSIVGSLAIISLLVGGIWMFSAAGDEARYKLGKTTVQYSLLGITIAAGSLVIAQQIKVLLGG